jgi:segregation and condensation protein B
MSNHLFSLAVVVEALLFASQKPLSEKEIRAALRAAAEAYPENSGLQAFSKITSKDVSVVLQELRSTFEREERSFELKETAAGWQLVTRGIFAPWIRQLFPESRPARLSASALETLAIIAYRQPLTRAEMEKVRGVAVDAVVQTLLDRGLIRIAGRAEIPGKPLLYETTQYFLEHFGLKSLDELPNSHELRRIEMEANEPATNDVSENETQISTDQTSVKRVNASSE